MGTRSLTRFYDEQSGVVLVNVYRQYDGYPTGHGDELARFVAERRIVNGFGQTAQRLANGVGCLAAQFIGYLKCHDGEAEGRGQPAYREPVVGNYYIYAPDSYDVGEDFVYEVRHDNFRAYRVSGYGESYKLEEIYNGPASGFDGTAIEKALLQR